jgi:salicylate hydroxylase
VAGFASGADGVVAALRQGLLRLEASGDCLIGADGARSLVRAKLLGGGAVSPALTRRTAWRALVDADRVAPEALRPESCLWLGREAHLVHYPLRGGAVVNVVAVVDENEAAPGPEEDWSRQGDPSVLAARFSSWHQDARALLATAPDWRRWPLVERDPLPGWTAGRVALLGDAAHPMPPFLAQGAAQAIEDAAALGAALQATRDVPQGLAAYAAARRARAGRVQSESRAQGRIYHLSGPAAFVRDAALQALGGERLLARYDWLYRVGRSSSSADHLRA